MARKRRTGSKEASTKKPELIAKDEDDDTAAITHGREGQGKGVKEDRAAAITTQKDSTLNRKTTEMGGGREAPVQPEEKGAIEEKVPPTGRNPIISHALRCYFFHFAGRLTNLLLFPVRFMHYSNRPESRGDQNTFWRRTEELDEYCGDLPVLCDDVCELILHKVTVDNGREIMKWKQVCRSWREAISSHEHFISHSFPPLPRTVSSATTTSTLGIVLSQKHYGTRWPVRLFHVYLEQDGNGAIRRQITEICNISSSRFKKHFAGYHASQGMVFLEEYCKRRFNSVIVQPFTGEYMHLPAKSPPRSKCSSNSKMLIGDGFIFDVLGNCYKVGRLFYESYRADDNDGNICELYHASNCEMFALGKDEAWRSIAMDQVGFYIANGPIWAVAINQMHLVWKLQDPANQGKIVLLELDAHKETFREKTHPACWDERIIYGMDLDVLGGRLSMTDRTDWMEGRGFFHVWVLKDYDDDASWALTYSIRIGPLCVIPSKITAVWGGRLVLCYSDGPHSLLLYDPKTTEYRSLGVMQYGKNIGAVEYEECTVSLKYVAKGKGEVVQRSSGRLQRGQRTRLQQVGRRIQPDKYTYETNHQMYD